MKKSVQCATVIVASLTASSAWAALVQYPNKASLLAAIHADLAGIAGLATPGLTPRTAINLTSNGRQMLIDSNVGGNPRLMSWGTGIGAPNPANVTTVYTQGRPTTAFGCFLRVANNLNQSVGGAVQIDTNAGTVTINVPSAGAYVAFTATTPFDHVDINALNGTLVEMIDDVLLADAAGQPASDHAVDAGRAVLGSSNPFVSYWSTDDQMPFLDTFGGSYGNSRDVWWTYTPAVTGVLTADTVGSSFDTLLGIYDGAIAVPSTGVLPLAMNDDAVGLQSRIVRHVLAGRTYYFRVGGFGTGGMNNATGTGTLNLSIVADPTCEADFNGDGSIDFFDYLDFVDAFSIGC